MLEFDLTILNNGMEKFGEILRSKEGQAKKKTPCETCWEKGLEIINELSKAMASKSS